MSVRKGWIVTINCRNLADGTCTEPCDPSYCADQPENCEERCRHVAHAEDECECGDYRYQHDEWVGKCGVCGDGTHPADGCQRYREAFRVGERGSKPTTPKGVG